MRGRRKFYEGVVNHVYQRTVDWVNIFYCHEDFLVFYTIFAVCVKSSNVSVLELCLMYDHIHFLIQTETMMELSAFVDRFTAWFVHEYNNSIGRSGKLFHKNFGSAPKSKEKAVRTAINYVGNNPVEKGLHGKAGEYRWNFLAYIMSKNPFSEKYTARKATKKLRNARKEVETMAKLNLPLKYVHLKRMMEGLSGTETEQLIDHIICMYLPFDYEKLLSYYGSYETMMTAMDSNTGSEYDIRESRDKYSHKAISDALNELGKHMPRITIRKISILPENEKEKIYRWMRRELGLSDWQTCKLLHMKKSPGQSSLPSR